MGTTARGLSRGGPGAIRPSEGQASTWPSGLSPSPALWELQQLSWSWARLETTSVV